MVVFGGCFLSLPTIAYCSRPPTFSLTYSVPNKADKESQHCRPVSIWEAAWRPPKLLKWETRQLYQLVVSVLHNIKLVYPAWSFRSSIFSVRTFLLNLILENGMKNLASYFWWATGSFPLWTRNFLQLGQFCCKRLYLFASHSEAVLTLGPDRQMYGSKKRCALLD